MKNISSPTLATKAAALAVALRQRFSNSGLIMLLFVAGACIMFPGVAFGAEDAPGLSFSFLQSPEVLNAVALLVGAIYAAFKGSEFYQARAGLKQRAFAALAENVVARVWHNFLRGRLDELDVDPSANPLAVANAKAVAHDHAATMLIEEAKRAGLANAPAIRAVLEKNDKSAIDAAIVQAVKRLKTGHAGYTSPSTKGA